MVAAMLRRSAIGCLVLTATATAAPMGTAFTYQGHLETLVGAPVDDVCNFRIGLWDAAVGGNQKGASPQIKTGVAVVAGVFTVSNLDYGAVAIDGTARWLAIEVQCPGDAGYTLLTPRLALTPAPHALALAGMRTPETAGAPNVIGGSAGNVVAAGRVGATIAGGENHTTGVTGDHGTIGGGFQHSAAQQATVSGGSQNTATGFRATIGGGSGNRADGPHTTIGGGQGNRATGSHSTVSGGGDLRIELIACSNSGVYCGQCVGGTNDGNACPATQSCPGGLCQPTATCGAGTCQPYPLYSCFGGLNSGASCAKCAVGGAGCATDLNCGANGPCVPDDSACADPGVCTSAYFNAASDHFATIGGGHGNQATGMLTTICGGGNNEATGYRSTIGGGYQNRIHRICNGGTMNGLRCYSNSDCPGGSCAAKPEGVTIGGGEINMASGSYSTVSGGQDNHTPGNYSAIAGGVGNFAIGSGSNVGGGADNNAVGSGSTVGGGINNWANGDSSHVGGGLYNGADGEASTVCGGRLNLVEGDYATISGGGPSDPFNTMGTRNRVLDDFGTIGGGGNNQAGDGAGTTADRAYATVGGGQGNTASGNSSTVGGGKSNTASASYSGVSGGFENQIRVGASYSAIAGGFQNRSYEDAIAIGGGRGNQAGVDDGNYFDSDGSAIAGGINNHVRGKQSVITGGFANQTYDNYSAIGGGLQNIVGSNDANFANAEAGTIAGGRSNGVLAAHGAVGGGESNVTGALHATIAGGRSNTVSGTEAAIGGGRSNIASGSAATVPGGLSNSAVGPYSFAAGRRAKSNHDGAFVWGDSTDADVTSSANNQFTARASGGVRFYSNTALTTGVTLAAGGGSWASISDRNVKRNVEPIDPRDVLERLALVPIATWNYESQDESIRHIGPMAQDFHAAFSVGEDERYITAIDADGVALAAIQGLHEIVQEKDCRIVELEARNAELEARLARIERLLAPLEGIDRPRN